MNKVRKFTALSRYRIAMAAFVSGMFLSLIFMFSVVKIFNHAEIVSGSKIKYYRMLDDKFGKYYDIDLALKDKSIYEQNIASLDEKLANDILGTVNDKYAEYFTASEYENFERNYVTSYTGIGISIDEKDGKTRIKRVINKSTAQAAGLRPGDIIVSIDGKKPAADKTAGDLIRGEAGTRVKIKIRRDNNEYTFSVPRTEIKYDNLSYEVYNKGEKIGYIKINVFKKGTAKDFSEAVRDLKKEGCNSVIIDLRNNPGGITEEAIKSVDVVLPACKIMTAKDSKGKEKVYNSDESSEDVSMAVLVNKNTASAAEIFAGAIKDNGAGKLIGSTTYGKGLIQGIYKLRDGSRFKITVQKYFTPSGAVIDEKGVNPDISLKSGVLERAENVLISD